ncbi:ATP-binding protein [Dyella flagellata]|nr:ATP-binding protein [Dyella flagellata]
MQQCDWSRSPLGPPEAWSPSLKTTVGMMLAAQAQIVLFWGPEFVALYNDAYTPTIGDKHPRALGRPAVESWTELWDDLGPLLRGVRETGKTFHAKDRAFYIERHGYGETVYFDVSYSAVPEVDGTVGGVLCIVSETTQRVLGTRRQTALLDLEDQLRTVGDAEEAKQIAAKLLQRELAASSVHYSDLDSPGTEQHLAGPSLLDHCRTTVLGNALGVETSSDTCLLDIPVLRNGQVVGRFSMACAPSRCWTDEEAQFARSVAERAWSAAERVRAEALLRESEARQRRDAERVQLALAAGAIIGTWYLDLATSRLQLDESLVTALGLDEGPRRQHIHLSQFVALVHPDDAAGMQATMQKAIERGGLYMHQHRIRRADGRYYWVEASGRINTEDDGTPLTFPGVLIDIEERRQTEQRIAASEAKYRTLFEQIDEGFCVVELLDGEYGPLSDYRHLEANPAFSANTGLPDVIGKRLRELYPQGVDGWIEIIRQVLLSGEPVRLDHELAATGRYLEIAAFRAGPVERRRVAILLKDVTARKHAEAELQRLNRELEERVAQAINERKEALARVHEMQKMETIGQLTGGVAHDFNNLLTPIVGALEMVARLQDGDERIKRLTTAGLQAAERARTLVQRLLAFARRQHLQARPTPIRNLVCGMEDLLTRSLGPQIRLEIDCAAKLPQAMTDPNQLELALLNLAVNARDAMPNGGVLKIAVTEQSVEGHSKLAAGRYVRIAVSDTGLGMDAQTMRRAVEPFFTTKTTGQGTGLGLSMVHGFAAQLGGDFSLTSEPGHGTTASLWLPASTEPMTDEPARIAVKAELRRVPATPVLLVDDEELVRLGTAEMLSDAGYVVQQVASGHEALAMLAKDIEVKVLITDYAMPGMTGVELAHRVNQLRPTLPVLMITGFAAMDGQAIGELPRLSKPFRQIELVDTVASLLEQTGRG